MQEFSVIVHRWALLRERGRCSLDVDNGKAATPPIFSGAGYANGGESPFHSDAVIDLESGGSIHESYQRQLLRKKNRSRSFSGNNINPDEFSSPNGHIAASETSTSGSAQVEFEICIRGGPCAEMEWWGRSKGIQPTLNKWTVWKTAVQIEDLHRVVITEFGDLAPRRPKLHTSGALKMSQLVQERNGSTGSPLTPLRMSSVTGSSSPAVDISALVISPDGGMKKSSSHNSLHDEAGVSREEIAADMRSIAGYLRTMLNQPTLHCKELFEFLEVPDHLIGSFRRSNSSRHHSADSRKNTRGRGDIFVDETSTFASAEEMVVQRQTEVTAVSEATDIDDDNNTEVNCRNGNDQWQGKEEEKWRKLYMTLRKGLKPREHLWRCYVFEGCVTGADIVDWLIKKGSIGTVKEAESIGEGLVNIGRLIPVCLGITTIHPRASSQALSIHGELDGATSPAMEDIVNNPKDSGSAYIGCMDSMEDLAVKFCNSTTYIYTYPGPAKQNLLKNKPLFTLFGDVISVSIPNLLHRKGTEILDNAPKATQLEDTPGRHAYSFEMGDSTHTSSVYSENVSILQDSLRSASPIVSGTISLASPEDGISPEANSLSQTDGFVEYEITLQNSVEGWTVFRRSVCAFENRSFTKNNIFIARYKEFVALNRLLSRAGIKSREPVSIIRQLYCRMRALLLVPFFEASITVAGAIDSPKQSEALGGTSSSITSIPQVFNKIYMK